ncbi:MAG: hypothetical protein ACHQRM_04500 [Bacteroidia bacterium]
MGKEELIQFIKKNDPYYHFVDMSCYTLEQLKEVVGRIKAPGQKKKIKSEIFRNN